MNTKRIVTIEISYACIGCCQEDLDFCLVSEEYIEINMKSMNTREINVDFNTPRVSVKSSGICLCTAARFFNIKRKAILNQPSTLVYEQYLKTPHLLPMIAGIEPVRVPRHPHQNHNCSHDL